MGCGYGIGSDETASLNHQAKMQPFSPGVVNRSWFMKESFKLFRSFVFPSSRPSYLVHRELPGKCFQGVVTTRRRLWI